MRPDNFPNFNKQPAVRDSQKFLLDGMLGSLSRKLRILGFDTVYEDQTPDELLIKESRTTSRILVTSDVQLQLNAMRRGVECILVKGSGDEERLKELFTKLGRKEINSGRNPRCSLCNGLLGETSEKTLRGKSTHRCQRCGKIYWRGSHWKKLDALFSSVNSSLETKIC